jgi:hypothetical protein
MTHPPADIHVMSIGPVDGAGEGIDPEVAACMRIWGVNEEVAREMLEIEKLGISWATPAAGSRDDNFPTAA